ncbi:unnamed protein product [Chrysoparadoxa australica]
MLSRTAKQLRSAVAWGNTNVKPKDYKCALEAAESTLRPVVFLRWGHELPEVPLLELARRSIVRFAETGRYVPINAIVQAVERVDALWGRTKGGSAERLALAAGYDMNSEGFVRRLPSGTMTQRPSSNSGSQNRPTENGSHSQMRTAGATRAYRVPQGRLGSSGLFAGGAAALAVPMPPKPWWERGLRVLGKGLSNLVTGMNWGLWGALQWSKQLERSDIPLLVLQSKEWQKFKDWRHSQYSLDDVDPQWPMYLPTNSTGKGPKKVTSYEPDTVDLVKQIQKIRKTERKYF